MVYQGGQGLKWEGKENKRSSGCIDLTVGALGHEL